MSRDDGGDISLTRPISDTMMNGYHGKNDSVASHTLSGASFGMCILLDFAAAYKVPHVTR
jgi:hypothetical protein